MHRPGHYGASLLGYAPLATALVAAGYSILAALGFGITLALAMVPDWDMRLPFIKHRGITHTVWTAIFIGAVIGWIAFILLDATAPAVVTAWVTGATATLSILSHIAADACTRMGVTPFAPLSSRRIKVPIYKLPLIKNPRANNPIVNYLFLVSGLAASAAAISIGYSLQTTGTLPW